MHPDLGTACNVMVEKRRADVIVSALSAEQIRELEKGKTQGTRHVRNFAVCSDENALCGYAQRRWSIGGVIVGARID